MTTEETIFADALGMTSLRERCDFLNKACGDDAELRARVEVLLVAHERAGTFLQSPPIDLPTTKTGATAPPVERPGAIVGSYKLLEQIGEGGMGVVFMAEQVHPVRRRVALKIIKPGMDSKRVIARFEAERQALAMMDHPNIAKVLEAGATDAGRPYFVMELVRGIPITEYCDQQELSPRLRLELFVQVCQAVQHAHQKSIIHRDLKPNNVLVTLADDGRPVPKVIDFGIAKATGSQSLTEQTLFTEFRQLIGTPLYMSPEQAEMNAVQDVDTRSDVYSLGVLLYELLTGTTPFDKTRLGQAAYDEIRRIIREEEPPRPSTRISTLGETLTSISAQRQTDPRKLSTIVRGELDWIVMRSLEKDRGRRYETAVAFAQDIQRYLADQPVQACPPSRGYRLRKFARRHRRSLRVAAAFSLLLIAATAVSMWLAVQATRAKSAAQVLKVQADKQVVVLAVREKLAQLQSARILVAEGDMLRTGGRWLDAIERYRQAESLFQRAGESTLPAELGIWEAVVNQPPLLNSFGNRTIDATSTAILPDGRSAVTGGNDGVVRLWDLLSGVEVRNMHGHSSSINAVAVSPDGRTIISGGSDGLVKVWNADTGAELQAFRGHGTSAVRVAEFLPDGHRVISGGDDGVLRIWEVQTARQISALKAGGSRITSLCLTRDGLVAVSGSGDQRVRIWDLERGLLIRTLQPATNPIASITLAVDESVIVTGEGSNGTAVTCWYLGDGEMLGNWQAHAGPVTSLTFDPNTKYVASTSTDQTIKMWTGSKQVASFGDQSGMIYAARFTSDGRMLLSAGERMRLWWNGHHGLRTLQNDNRRIAGMALSADGRMVAVAGEGRTGNESHSTASVKVLDIATGQTLRIFRQQEGRVSGVAFSPDGSRILAASEDATVRLWELAGGHMVQLLRGHVGAVRAIAFCNARRAVTGGDDYMLKFWDLDNGHLISSLSGHTAPVNCVAAAGGTTIASGDASGTLKLWGLRGDTASIRWSYYRSGNKVMGVGFSPDGRQILAGYSDGTAEVYEAETGRLIRAIKAHTQELLAVAFWPDGMKVVTAGNDASLAVWDIASGDELHRFKQAATSSVAITPDAKLIVSGGADGRLQIRDLVRRTDPLLESDLAAARDKLQRNPHDPAGLAVVGRWYALIGVNDWAAEFLERSRESGADVPSLVLARCYWGMDNTPAAIAEFKKALERQEGPADYLRLCLATADSQDPVIRAARARRHLAAGRFRLAADDLAVAIRGDPTNHWDWYDLGCLLAYLGESGSYRAHCHAMLERFGSTAVPDVADQIVKTALLLPGGEFPARLMQTYDRLAEAEGPANAPKTYALAKAMAEYRSGQFQSSLKWLAKARHDEGLPVASAFTADVVASMALYQLGEKATARKVLNQTRGLIQAKLSQPGQAIGPSPENWLMCQIMLREAEQLIDARMPSPFPTSQSNDLRQASPASIPSGRIETKK